MRAGAGQHFDSSCLNAERKLMICLEECIGVPGAPLVGVTTPIPSVSLNDAKDANRGMSGSNPKLQPSAKTRILLADDQHDVLTALELLLKLHGYRTQRTDSPSALLRASSTEEFDLILMDLNYSRDTTSGQEGLDLLKALRYKHSATPIVVMTAWGNVELAVEAMRLGATDFIQKPWDNPRLLQTLAKGLEHSRQARRAEAQTRSELEIARHVHQKLFPSSLRPIPNLDYAGRCIPARVVGGDYYDFFDAGDEQLVFILADVSGKGVAAAMLMANLQACLRTQFGSGVRNPVELLQQANKLFYDSTPASQYVTLFYGHYDGARGRLEYLNCGHPPPIVVRGNGSTVRPESTATVLGLFPDWRPESVPSMPFTKGDLLIAFTDGITDSSTADGKEFGEERLMTLIQSFGEITAQECITRILSITEIEPEVDTCCDDRTVVAMRSL